MKHVTYYLLPVMPIHLFIFSSLSSALLVKALEVEVCSAKADPSIVYSTMLSTGVPLPMLLDVYEKYAFPIGLLSCDTHITYAV